MSFLSPIKKFVTSDGTLLEFILGLFSLIVVLGFVAADLFWQITPKETSTKVAYILNLINLVFFYFRIGNILESLNIKSYTKQLILFIFGASITGTTWSIGHLIYTVSIFLEIENPVLPFKEGLWFGLTPGVGFLAFAALSFILEFVFNMWKKLKDARDRA